MNSSSIDRTSPLPQRSSERTLIRPPRISVRPEMTPVYLLSNSAFMRSWAARRSARALARELLR